MDLTANNNQTIANSIGTIIWVHGTYHVHSFFLSSLYFLFCHFLFSVQIMASLWHSFVEAITPGCDQPVQGKVDLTTVQLVGVHQPGSTWKVVFGSHTPK